jgi:hypothetical protein
MAADENQRHDACDFELGSAGPVMSESPARCLTCYYVIENLPLNRCPECGRPFDPEDEATFTRNPPFVWWRLWFPGLALAVASGTVCSGLLLLAGSTGWAVTIGVPVTVGAVLGYRCRLSTVLLTLLAICATIGVVVTLFAMHISGLLCSIIALIILFPPAMIGVFLGMGLRNTLKRSNFDQRSYLPAVIVFLIMFGWGMAEKRFATDQPTEAITTHAILDVPITDAWNRLAFYEECTGPKPWLLRIAGPVPLRTITEQDGVTRTCLYERGFIRKRVTAIESPALLAFDVLEHRVGEERSVRLVGGSFSLEPAGDGRTRVTLTTRYRPKLRPRFYWRPFERLVCDSVHAHVLNGMKRRSTPSELVQFAEPHSQASHE